MNKQEYLHLRIDGETKSGAETLANRLGINVSQLVRMLIKNSLMGNVITIDGATALENSGTHKLVGGVSIKKSKQRSKQRA